VKEKRETIARIRLVGFILFRIFVDEIERQIVDLRCKYYLK
jgi:hypothetical protein